MQLPPADELVLISGCHPIRAKKARYFEDPENAGAHPPAVPGLTDAQNRHRPPNRLPVSPKRRSLWAGAVVAPPSGIRTQKIPPTPEFGANSELPEHEEIVPEPAKPVHEFEPWPDEEPDDEVQRQRHVMQRTVRQPSPARSFRSIPATT